MKRTYDVAVLGAGVAGSSMAKALGDNGWDTLLIDRHRFPRHKVCGEFLSPESQKTLNNLGLLKHVETLKPSSINQTRLIFGQGDTLEIPLPGHAMGVSRYSLDEVLHNAALESGVGLQLATTVTSVVPNGRGYIIETRQGSEIDKIYVRAVIAAWGANNRSGLPGYKTAGLRESTYIGVKSHYEGIEMEPVVELYFFPGGYMGISPIERGRINVAALLDSKTFHNSKKSILGMIEAAAELNPKLSQRLASAIPVQGTQAAVAPIHLSRKLLVWDLYPHVGDAAVMIPPLCGDGMSMALRSAYLNSSFADSYLRGEISLFNWQKKYRQALECEFKGPLRWGRLMQLILSNPGMSRFLPGLAKLAPGLAINLVKATRLPN
jgi:flavin-dependent dehydrogenase